MKRNDYLAFAINGIIFLVAGGFLLGLAITHEAWIFLVITIAFILIGVVCVMAIAESARENHRD